MNRWKVLVVDDQPDITANLQKQLSQQGYDVRIAQNFTEANFIIERYSFDIAILDVMLPDGNGIDVYRLLRQKNDDIYTIMITGNATVDNTITALNEGINAFLIKPFSNEQLKGNLIQAHNTLQLKKENAELIRKLQENRQFYEDLLNSTSEAILVVDLNYKIQYLNQAARKFFRASEDQLYHQSLQQFIDDGYKVLSHIHQQLVLGQTIAGYRVGIKTSNQKTFDAHLTADFLKDKDEHIEGLIINLSNPMFHDEVFSRILRKEKLSTIVNLANALGHEIRNPINILYGRLQLLAEENSDENFQHGFESISRQINRLLNITELLGKFNFSREDSIPELFSIMEILQTVLKEKDLPFLEKSITFNTEYDESEYIVEGNLAQFSDAFRYLLDALLEFCPAQKEITISTRAIKNHLASPWFELQFVVPGVQINQEELIDPYQSGDVKVNSLVGLEMTIMHTIFSNYGAKVESQIEDEENTVIRIRFPLSEGKKIHPRAGEIDNRIPKK